MLVLLKINICCFELRYKNSEGGDGIMDKFSKAVMFISSWLAPIDQLIRVSTRWKTLKDTVKQRRSFTTMINRRSIRGKYLDLCYQ